MAKTKTFEIEDTTEDEILTQLVEMNLKQDRILRALEDLVHLMGRSQVSPS